MEADAKVSLVNLGAENHIFGRRKINRGHAKAVEIAPESDVRTLVGKGKAFSVLYIHLLRPKGTVKTECFINIVNGDHRIVSLPCAEMARSFLFWHKFRLVITNLYKGLYRKNSVKSSVLQRDG